PLLPGCQRPNFPKSTKVRKRFEKMNTRKMKNASKPSSFLIFVDTPSLHWRVCSSKYLFECKYCIDTQDAPECPATSFPLFSQKTRAHLEKKIQSTHIFFK